MKIKEIISYLENIIPLNIQESYDNSGFLVGNPENELTKILITIDVTEDVINEAIEKSCNLIISHHPLIFGNLKNITTSNFTGKCIIKAIKHDIAIYAAHTNLDNLYKGVNSILCEKLGIINYKILKPKTGILKKLVTFCPEEKAEDVRKALFDAGAGHIGNYDSCSFNSKGAGTFKALDNANPYVGELNKLHTENEIKIEVIYPSFIEKALLKSLFNTHPYEEVAYDIYPLENKFKEIGEGMIGELKKETDTKQFLQKIKKELNIDTIKHSEIIKDKIKKVAVCGGAGGFLINEAIKNDADIFLTADLKYHQFFEGNDKMIIADIGHFESEQFAKNVLFGFLKEKFPTFAFLISNVKTNPVYYFNIS